MKLKKLTLKNIRSYEEASIDFVDGSTLLSGDIGSGKTSILLAIEYALFGLQPGQRGTSLLRSGKSGGEVTLEFEVSGVECTVTRRLKRGAKSVSQDFATLVLDSKVEELSVTELKTRILALLNYPPEFLKRTNLLYKYTVYSPQEEMKQIILEEPEARLSILRHVFGMDKYKIILENIQIIISKLRESVRFLQAVSSDLEEIKNKLEHNKSLVLNLENSIKIKKEKLIEKTESRKKQETELNALKDKINEKKNFEKEIEKTNIMISNKRNQLNSINEEISDLKDKLDSTQSKSEQKPIEVITKSISEIRNTLDILNNDYINIQSKINSIEINKKDNLERKNRVFKIDICPTCLQNVPENHKHNILNETEAYLSKWEKEKADLEKEIITLNKKIQKGKFELERLEEERSELEILKVRLQEADKAKSKIQELDKTKKSLISDLEFLEAQKTILKKSEFEFSKYDSIFTSKETELKASYILERKSEIELAEVKKEKELKEIEILEIKDKIKQKENNITELNRITEIEEWLSKEFTSLINFTEKKVMFKLRQEFSKLFKKWFEMLTNDEFDINLDETFSPVILQGEYELDYSFLSGGERTAVALAYRLALNQIISSIYSKIKTKGLVILDEPTDGFSDRQLDKVREVLYELETDQLILVSHEPKIESFVDNIIRLKKAQGVSSRG